MERRVSLLLCLVLAACAPARPAPVAHYGSHVGSAAGIITAQRGDTVWSVSNRYRLPLRDIIDLNGLQPPYALSAGQRLRLPPPVDYKVRPGDTAQGVARMFGVSVSQLSNVNNFTTPRLQIGQVLRIPARHGAAPVVNASPEVAMASANIPSTSVNTGVSLAARPERVEAMSLDAPAPAASTPTPSPVFQPPAPSPMAMQASSAPQKFRWPVRGRVVSRYGAKPDGLYNDGINIAVPKGTPVKAAAGGTVAYVGSALESYGNMVLIRHTGGMVTAYAHLSSVTVKQGMEVRAGQNIGAAGASGSVSSSQLHFEVRRGTETLDPLQHMG